MNQNNPFNLESCPHCNSPARFEIYNDGIRVSCSNCGCSSPQLSFSDVAIAPAMEQLHKIWNVRFL